MAIASTAVNALIIALTYLKIPATTAEVLTQLHVKVTPGTDPNSIKSSIGNVESVQRLFTLPKERLRELSEVKPGLPDLTLWYKVAVKMPMSDAEVKVEAELDSLDDIVNFVIPKEIPPPGVTPDFRASQGYLRPNTSSNNGVDAEKSWTFPGGNGEGITIYDVEYNWEQAHEDLDPASDVGLLLNHGDSIASPFGPNHGTAVLGEMISTENGLGVKGISYGASVGLAPEKTTLLGSNRANAIMLAVNDGKAGDVILLEMQTGVCGGGQYGPAEGDRDVFDATAVAVANGITVVAAAGNGNVDLDSPQCGNTFNRNKQDSGAIIVGAGGTGWNCPNDTGAREKLSFSSFGSRVDVQGWGRCVWTTGYGSEYKDPDHKGDEKKWYTGSFSGTSSASPIVAAAVANIQGIALKRFGAPLDPLELRTLLTNTGLPQVGGGGNIGPLVNLGLAIDSLIGAPTRSPTKPDDEDCSECLGFLGKYNDFKTASKQCKKISSDKAVRKTCKNVAKGVLKNGKGKEEMCKTHGWCPTNMAPTSTPTLVQQTDSWCTNCVAFLEDYDSFKPCKTACKAIPDETDSKTCKNSCKLLFKQGFAPKDGCDIACK